MLSLLLNVETSPNYLSNQTLTTAATILGHIKQRAIVLWGEEKWLVNLVREYAKVAQAQGDQRATPNNRRAQIHRTFEVGSCTLDTAILLAAAVGCRFQMSCTTVEIKQF